MRWNKFRLKTLAAAEDLVICALADAGIEGVEIEDHTPLSKEELDSMFVDIMPEGPEDDGIAYLSFYLEEDADVEAVLTRAREELDRLRAFTDIGECTIEQSQTEDVDWINNWKQYFHQFYVDDILITPSWEEVSAQDAGKMIIHIDPGTAFGTGMHETTQLCLRALRKVLKNGMQMLDVGTGSGILSIAGLMMGAGHATGTDLDPCTVTAVAENLEANGIAPGKMDLLIGNLIDDQKIQDQVGYDAYEIVTANILADILVPMMAPVSRAMKTGGYCITSGILEGKQGLVAKAMEEAGMEVIREDHQGEWVSLTGRKN